MVKQNPGGTAKKCLIYHISKNNHHSKKQFPAFYSSSQGLSNDIIFTSDFTKNHSTFWWRHQLWRHNLTFCHNFRIKINWRTKKAHLPNLVQKYINQANIAFMKHYGGDLAPTWKEYERWTSMKWAFKGDMTYGVETFDKRSGY